MRDSGMSERVSFKPGNMLYPLPAVMVSCGEYGREMDIITIAWTGTVCSDPPMVYISVRPERHSFPLIRRTGEFVINLVTEDLTRAMDYCGVRSGKDRDKWKDCHLTPLPAETVRCPFIAESPVNIECKVISETDLGTHHMFLARVTAVKADKAYMDKSGRFDLNAAHLLAYSHGTYYGLGKKLGSFGYSVKKPAAEKDGKRKTGKSGRRKPALREDR